MSNKIHCRGSSLIRLALITTLLIPWGAASAASPNKGKTIYDMNCAMCHGDNGQGNMPGTPDFSNQEGLFTSDLALVKRIEAGNKACPAYEGVLKQTDILDLIAYMRTL